MLHRFIYSSYIKLTNMNVTNLKRNAVQKFFNLHGQYKQIILTEDGINKEFYPTCGLIFLLFICTYLTYRLAIKESFLNQLIFKFHEKLNEKQVIILIQNYLSIPIVKIKMLVVIRIYIVIYIWILMSIRIRIMIRW